MVRPIHASRALACSFTAALALVAALPTSAQTASNTGDLEANAVAPQSRGEERLAKMLEGRVAGEPTSCIRALLGQRVRTIEGTAYVYGSGKTIYVQRTSNPDQISDTHTLVTNRLSGSQLCRFDITTTIDRYNGFFTGAAFFEDFVPYSLVKPAARAEG
jgi:hypothetical protein